MKHRHQFVLFVSLCVAVVMPATGQISITAADVGATLTPGNVNTAHIDTATHTVNIGGLGATSWDFSALLTSYVAGTTMVDPDTTAFIGEYPGATHALQAGSGIVYFKLASNFEQLGYAQAPPTQIRSHQMPPQVLNQLPMTMGTTWTSTYQDCTYVTISGTTYPSATNFVAVNTVDAYGALTLPGGSVHQALRLKLDRTATTGIFSLRTITYQFLAKNGASVSVVPSDTGQPTTGSISISNSSWFLPAGATAVEELPGGTLPSSFALEQNYPNPFNPSTTIQFSVAQNEFVSLKVYDLLGREIAVLAAEPLSPGRYSVDWDGTGFPSGVYVYRLQAGAFIETKRFVLVR